MVRATSTSWKGRGARDAEEVRMWGAGTAGVGGGAGAAVATIEASSEGAGTNGGMNAVAIAESMAQY